MTQFLTPERLAEATNLIRYESSIAFYSARARETVLLLIAEAEEAARLRLELTAVEESATRTRLADMDAPQPTPGRDARYELYAALTYPQWNPATNSHSTGDEKAERLIDAHRAQVLAKEADALVAACPEHSKADEAWMDCPCEYAGELRRRASVHATEATS